MSMSPHQNAGQNPNTKSRYKSTENLLNLKHLKMAETN